VQLLTIDRLNKHIQLMEMIVLVLQLVMIQVLVLQ